MRSLPADNISRRLAGLWPQAAAPMVTLYFGAGPFLIPVSRRLPASDALPRMALEALLAGPSQTSGLVDAIPRDVKIRSFAVSGGVAVIDLSAGFLGAKSENPVAQNALVETMTALPGVRSVSLSVEGKPLVLSAERVPLLYYASAHGLVAVPVSANTPRDTVAQYLSGPPDPSLTGLPADVQLLGYNYNPNGRLVSLSFTYKPSIRVLALETPERMRFVLLGLIASLTDLPQVDAVQLDFEGRTRLGVGQCSDLLRTRQPKPELLNDERLLGR